MSSMRERRNNIGKAPAPSRRGLAAKHNRQLPAQTRKILGRHYAAKYRVR
jgi:hypothetical protein